MQHELSKAVAAPLAVKQRAAAKAVTQAEETLKRVHEAPDHANSERAKRGPGRPPKAALCLGQVTQAVDAARQKHQRLTAQREQVTQSIRAMGHAYHFVDLERGVRRNGRLIAGDIQRHIDTIRTIAHQEGLSKAYLERIAKAERVVPKMQATIEFVSGYVRQQGRQLDLTPPQSYYLDRVALTRTGHEGAPLRALVERLRTPLCAPGGALGEWNVLEQNQLQHKAKTLAEVFQRSSSNVEGRNGYLSLRHHQLRGLDHPSKRACLTAVHTFFLTRSDGTTAAERFFGQKSRSMFAAILGSVEIPPVPLSPPRRALG